MAVNEQSYSRGPWDFANEPSQHFVGVGVLRFSGVVSIFLLTVISPEADSCNDGGNGALMMVSAASLPLGAIQKPYKAFLNSHFIMFYSILLH